MDYREFLKTKEIRSANVGFDVDKAELNKNLFPFQADIVAWALKKGKAAVLIACGLGKTAIQLSWAEEIVKRTGGNVLIIAPLSVVRQTQREAVKFGFMRVNVCREPEEVEQGINITNYEIVYKFNSCDFIGVVLDESSILKGFTSRTTIELTEQFYRTPYKLLCTATIAPNDRTEIGTSCEFLGIMSRTEMLATYFIHDGGKTSEWRLKKAGASKFWEWFATWAICFNNPNELGYNIEGYNLPNLNIHTVITKSDIKEGELVVRAAETLQERREARKESIEDRTNKALELVQSNEDQWLVWVDYNDESEALRKKIPGCVEIKGSDDPETKANASLDFSNGKIKCLVSKGSIFGFGSNFQSCHQMIFCGISDSWERFYQSVRRCWRFGQDHDVDVYIIISEREINILENVKQKEKLNEEMQKQMISLMRDVTLSEIKHTVRITTDYKPTEELILPEFMKGA